MITRTPDEVLEYEQRRRDREQVIAAANELAAKLEHVEDVWEVPC